MISYTEALKAILDNAHRLTLKKISIEDAEGYWLAEDIYSKIAMPPFNKSAMDGYAVIAEDTQKPPVKLKCIGLIQAGGNFKRRLLSGECVKIMTGAALPKGADSVVMIEDTTASAEFVNIKGPVSKWQNVCFKGEDLRKGNKVLGKNQVISSACVALLATVGRRRVKVIKRPQVTILNTGGEIVPAGRKLSRGRIYNSNGPQLVALLKSDGIVPRYLGIAQDKPEELMQAVRKGLKSDMFLISGGVSMGDYDLVPEILRHAGVKEIFHKVNIKPGKPLFLGRKTKTLVFGIPGNPVSNFLAYQLFIRPAIYKMTGYKNYKPVFKEGIVGAGFHTKAGRKQFVLAKIFRKADRYCLFPSAGHGSADTLALSKADGFMVVDEGSEVIKKDSKIQFITWKTI